MSGYFTYYAELNITCFIIFGIMLVHDLFGVDRQEKQIKYDNALIAFMFYFVSDTIWAGVEAGVLPRSMFTVSATCFANYLIMAAMTYTWLRYVMAVEKIPNRDQRRNRLFTLFPFIVSTTVLIIMYCITPELFVSADLEIQPAVYLFLIAVPYIYIAAVLIYALSRAHREPNPIEKRKHLYIGLYPLIVVVGGLSETFLMPTSPLFCLSATILMLIFYIESMESRISIDPLTGLNNRGQLIRYVSQRSNMRQEGRMTYVVMVDVDDFKAVNDTYGHAEGDRALVIIANALKDVAKECAYPTFLGRYGGDEFVLIVHPAGETDLKPLVDNIRAQIDAECKAQQLSYLISISIGYDALANGDDTFQKCMKRADEKLYHDKDERKASSDAQLESPVER